MTPSSRRRLLTLAAALLGAIAFWVGVRTVRPAPGHHPLTGRQIAGIATDGRWMDRDEREAEEAPDRALALLQIAPGQVVADVGAGTGYMTVRLARLVGPSGRVFATDIQPALLDDLRRKANTAGLTNVTIVQSSETDARLPAGAISLELLVDVYHEFAHPQAMLRSLRTALQPDGRLVLIEYRGEDPSVPVAPTHRLTVADARTEVEAEGFRFDQLITELPRQHILIFRPAPDR